MSEEKVELVVVDVGVVGCGLPARNEDATLVKVVAVAGAPVG